MKNKLFISAIAVLLTFGSVGFALAAPYYTFTKTIVPESDSAFDVGTSTAAYRNLYIDQICLAGDCQVAWPSASSGTISTSTVPTVGQLAYWTSNAFPSLLGSVATGTISNGTGISVTAGQSVIGSGLTITNTAPDQTVAFTNGTGISVTGTYPNFTVTNTAPQTFSYPFPSNATTTNITFSNGLTGTLTGNADTVTNGVYTTGAGTVFENPLTFNYPLTRATNAISLSGFATTSATCSGATTCDPFTVIGASPITISSTGGTSAFEIATTSDIAISGLGYFTKTSGRTTLGSAATTTPSFGLGLTGGGTWTVLGSAPTLSIATSSLYSGTTGQFPYFTGTNTLAGTSTISIATNGTLTVNNGLAGDASTQYGATSREWTVGYDATDHSFAIASSTALGTSNALTIDKSTLYTTLVGLTLTNDLTVANGGTGASTLTGILIGNGTSAFTAIAGNTCTNQFLRAFTSSGGTCATVANTDLANSTISGIALGSNLADLTATNSTLTFSGTYTGATARTIGLNLANENTWSVGAIFANATTTGTLTIPVGASVTTPLAGNMAIDTTTGQVRYSAVNGTTKVLGNGLSEFGFSYATSTAFTGTTTRSLGSTRSAQTWVDTQCYTDAGTANVQFYWIQTGTTQVKMNMVAATTATTTTTFSSNNVIPAGAKRFVDIGTPASSPTEVACTMNKELTAD